MTPIAQTPTVVVYGGTGFFGKLVVDDLLVTTTAQVVVAGRKQPRAALLSPRVTFVVSDLNDPVSVQSIVAGAAVVVHCAGPYQSQEPTLLRAAIAAGVHYIDLAEDQELVRESHRSHDEARRAGVTLLSGLSVVPGLAALLAKSMQGDFDQVRSIRTFVAPGTRGSRGTATVRALLSAAGRPLHLLRNGSETAARGWSEPEWMEFPPPVGWRLEHLAMDSADHDVLAREFGARRVEFKAGSEFAWLNRSLAAGARWHALTGFPRLERWANPMRVGLKWLGRFGTDAGGVIVEMSGTKSGYTMTRQIAVVAERAGERIPSSLAPIAVDALLHGELTARGAVPLSSWLSTRQLFRELKHRGFQLWTKSEADSSWQPVADEVEISR